MKKIYITVAVSLIFCIISTFHMATGFNESKRHPMDIVVLPYILPAIIINEAIHIGLILDAHNYIPMMLFAFFLNTTCLVIIVLSISYLIRRKVKPDTE